LPALDGFGLDLEARVRGELVLDSPAADTGPVGFKVQAAT